MTSSSYHISTHNQNLESELKLDCGKSSAIETLAGKTADSYGLESPAAVSVSRIASNSLG